MVNFRPLLPFQDPDTGRFRVFRSAAITALGAPARGTVRARLDVRYFIDLRTTDETQSALSAGDEATDLVRVSVPVGTRRPSPDGPRPSVEEYVAYYRALLDDAASELARAFAAVARASPNGVVFGCAQGKDRTGLLAAALLEAAGVEWPAIARDFARSGPALKRAAGLFERSWQRRGLDRESYLRRYELGDAPLRRLYETLPPGPRPLLSALVAAAPRDVDMNEALWTLGRLARRDGAPGRCP